MTADKPGPSRRTIIGWTAGMLCFLALACFIGLVVVPVWQTRRAVERWFEVASRATNVEGALRAAGEQGIERLGGKRAAVPRLALYRRLPAWLAPHRNAAGCMLIYCEEAAFPHLLELLEDENPGLRTRAAETLGQIGNPDAVGPLIAALGDEHSDVRSAAAYALADLGDSRATEPLQALARDTSRHNKFCAEQALERIKVAKKKGKK